MSRLSVQPFQKHLFYEPLSPVALMLKRRRAATIYPGLLELFTRLRVDTLTRQKDTAIGYGEATHFRSSVGVLKAASEMRTRNHQIPAACEANRRMSLALVIEQQNGFAALRTENPEIPIDPCSLFGQPNSDRAVF
jgi:hypothetical protein